MSCGCTPSITKESDGDLVRRGRRSGARPAARAARRVASARSSASQAAAAAPVERLRGSRAPPPGPTAPAMFGVPASKRCGGTSNSVFSKRHRADHVAAALVGRHRLEELARGRTARRCRSGRRPCGPRRRRSRSPAPATSIAQVRRRLRAVDQHRHAARVRERDHLAHRVDGAERVRDVGRRRRSGCARPSRRSNSSSDHLAAVVDRRHRAAARRAPRTPAARARCWSGAPAR